VASRFPFPSPASLMPLKKANVAASGGCVTANESSPSFWMVTCVWPTILPPLRVCGAA